MLRVESRQVESAESGVVDEVQWTERSGVVPDVDMAESPAMRDCKRIHTIERNKLEANLGAVRWRCCREVRGYSRHGG